MCEASQSRNVYYEAIRKLWCFDPRYPLIIVKYEDLGAYSDSTVPPTSHPIYVSSIIIDMTLTTEFLLNRIQ